MKEILCILGIVFVILIVFTLIGLYIYALIAYANTPISEVPFWVFWF